MRHDRVQKDDALSSCSAATDVDALADDVERIRFIDASGGSGGSGVSGVKCRPRDVDTDIVDNNTTAAAAILKPHWPPDLARPHGPRRDPPLRLF